MTISVVRLGSPRAKAEGPRLGTVRRPPHIADFSIGCYCEDERRCHRSILREILGEHGARIAP